MAKKPKRKKKPKQRELVKVRFKDGVASHYLIKGNKRATPVKNIANMADKGLIKGVHSYDVHHARSNPNDSIYDNLRKLPKF